MNIFGITPPARHSVMAIVNVTPDSFYESSRTVDSLGIELRTEQVVAQGANIIDLGGYSTRPGAADVPPNEEFARLNRAFEVVRRIAPLMPISVDTFRSEVVQRLYDHWGSFTVNDISAGGLDSEMIPAVGRLGLPYIAMHSRGTPLTMQSLTHYDDLIGEIRLFFEQRIDQCRRAGIVSLAIDPGFGFAKSVEQNFELLGRLGEFTDLGVPILAGLSRKSMIWRTLSTTPDGALNGTTALNWEALRQGAAILRVHDVPQAVECVKLFEVFLGGKE